MAKKKGDKKKRSAIQAASETAHKGWVKSEGVTQFNSVSGVYGKSKKRK